MARNTLADGRTETFDDKESRDNAMEDSYEQWLQELATDVEVAQGSEKFKDWLEAVSAFHDYSVRNQALIRMQMPNATRVASYWTWKNEFNRHVKEGEDALWIWAPNTITAEQCPHCGNAANYHEGNDDLDCPLAPESPDKWDDENPDEWKEGEILVGFSPAPVFDVSQTEGEPLPDLNSDPERDAPEFVEAAVAALESLEMGVEITEDWNKAANGVCDTSGSHPEITVEQRSPGGTFRTLLHEGAHGLLHMESSLETSEKEIEAEAVAYVVLRHFGFEPQSEFYLATWADEGTDILETRLQAISNTAQTLIEAIKTERAS